MFVSRVLFRASRSLRESSSFLFGNQSQKLQISPILSNRYLNLITGTSGKFAPVEVSLLHHVALNSFAFQRFGISSTAPPDLSENKLGSNKQSNSDSAKKSIKKNSDSAKKDPTKNGNLNQDDLIDDSILGNTGLADQTEESSSTSYSHSAKSRPRRQSRQTKRIAFSDSDSEDDEQHSMDDLVKLVAQKEELLKLKHKEIEKMQDKVLRSYAEMENVMDRTRREAENSKKFAVQNFAKSLLDVADNLGRASSVVKDSFSKINLSEDSGGAVPLLKTLLEGVEMTEKQLTEVFKKSGVEKYDPTNEPFDPHRHHAVFQIPDGSKPPGTVAIVLKSGYMLYDRVLRPAEVGVTVGNDPIDHV